MTDRSCEKRTKPVAMMICPSDVVSGARFSERSVPPYLPTAFVGVTTTGSGGRRSSTGGSEPALTFSANEGASP